MKSLAREFYDSLKEAGDLSELLPNSTGKWENDKELFLVYYQKNNEIINELEVDLDDDSIF